MRSDYGRFWTRRGRKSSGRRSRGRLRGGGLAASDAPRAGRPFVQPVPVIVGTPLLPIADLPAFAANIAADHRIRSRSKATAGLRTALPRVRAAENVAAIDGEDRRERAGWRRRSAPADRMPPSAPDDSPRGTLRIARATRRFARRINAPSGPRMAAVGVRGGDRLSRAKAMKLEEDTALRVFGGRELSAPPHVARVSPSASARLQGVVRGGGADGARNGIGGLREAVGGRNEGAYSRPGFSATGRNGVAPCAMSSVLRPPHNWRK